MTALDDLLESYRAASVSEREKGTYFERQALACFACFMKRIHLSAH